MKMKSKVLACAVLLGALAVAGCGDQGSSSSQEASSGISWEAIPEDQQQASPAEASSAVVEAEPEPEPEQEPVAAEVPAGMYLSEITGEPIDESLRDQRPIAVMVDNETKALPHYGTAEADVVYEMMNSTANGRVTRLMCIVKDWGQIKQLGSIRSTRPTNILIAAEWNAVLCHDGGPYHNDAYFANKWAEHFSGTFSRVNNGKSREFTEYIVSGDLDKNFKNSGYTTTYNDYAPEGATDSHFVFTPYGTTVDLSSNGNAIPATSVDIKPFTHNKSQLTYNSSTGKYEYSEYGNAHKDAEDGEVLAFDNVILQKCTFNQLDENGYLIYNCIDVNQPGYYLTGGYAIPIEWTKGAATAITRFYSNGQELAINPGKTYIGIIPSDTWGEMKIK